MQRTLRIFQKYVIRFIDRPSVKRELSQWTRGARGARSCPRDLCRVAEYVAGCRLTRVSSTNLRISADSQLVLFLLISSSIRGVARYQSAFGLRAIARGVLECFVVLRRKIRLNLEFREACRAIIVFGQ